jgi:hypothetical protein
MGNPSSVCGGSAAVAALGIQNCPVRVGSCCAVSLSVFYAESSNPSNSGSHQHPSFGPTCLPIRAFTPDNNSGALSELVAVRVFVAAGYGLCVTLGTREHWNTLYGTKAADKLSWFQAWPQISLRLLSSVGSPSSAVIDIGGGASTL